MPKGSPSEGAARELVVEEGDDAAAFAADDVVLFLGEIADPDLHDARDAGQPAGHVEDDRGVRVGEALVGVAEIGVGVEVEHAEAGVALGVRGDGAERGRVIAPDQADDLALVEPGAGDGADALVELARELVDAGEARLEIGITRDLAAGGDHRLGGGAGLGVPEDDLRIDGEQRDPGLVRAPGLRVEEVDLAAAVEDRGRAAHRAAPVRGRRLPGHGDDHDAGVVGAMRQPVDPVAARRRTGVEGEARGRGRGRGGGAERFEGAGGHGATVGGSARSVNGLVARKLPPKQLAGHGLARAGREMPGFAQGLRTRSEHPFA